MAVKKSCHQVSLVAMFVAALSLANKIAKQGFSNLWIGVGREGAAQHRRIDGQVEQAQPAVHAGERRQKILVILQGNCLEAGGHRDFSANAGLQQLFVKALDRSQNCQLPFGIFDQFLAPRGHSHVDGLQENVTTPV